MEQFQPYDKQILQALACRVAEYAASPEQDRIRKLWTLHNELKTDEPVVHIAPENGWAELIPDSDLQCLDETARSWEVALRQRLYYAEVLRSDYVMSDVFEVSYVKNDDGWGVPIVVEGKETGKAFRIKPAIEEYEEVFDQLHVPQLTIDYEASDRLLNLAHDTFDGILRVRRHAQWWWTLGMTQDYIYLRGFENFLCDFRAEPEWVHRMMNMLCEGYLKKIDWLQEQKLLCSNVGNYGIGSGGYGFISELPDLDGGPCTPMDMWGFVESQETNDISSKMYHEFIFPYHLRIAERFGLNCYGCCEDVVRRWDSVKQIPRLRRVSCCPWSKRPAVAELLGNQYVASHKLLPTPLAMPQMDEDFVRRDLRAVLDNMDGTIPELIMKDTNTFGKNPRNAARWVELAREEIART